MNDRILATELCNKGFTMGYAEVRRLIAASAIKVNGETVKSWKMIVRPGDEIMVGKRKRMVVE